MSLSSMNKKFMDGLERYIRQQEETMKQVVSNTIVSVVSALVDRTPSGQPDNWSQDVYKSRVQDNGYEPGRFKSSWNVALDKVPSIGYNNSIDKTGEPSIRNAVYEMDTYNLNIKNISIVNTALNPDTGEYYPIMIQSKETSAFSGYSSELHVRFPEITYDYAAGMQDNVLGTFSGPSSSEFKQILERVVRTTK